MPNKSKALKWLIKLAEFDNRCAYCGKSEQDLGEELTKDHIVPISKGGSDDDHNIIPAYVSCNSSKGDMSLDEFLRRMSTKK